MTPGAAASRDVYSGELRARYETDLGFRIGGKIVARLVDAGARVSKGQVLARLDPEDAKLAAQGATAQLASAEADFALAKSELARYQDLLAKKFISQSAFDVKQNAFLATQAKVEQVRTQAAITSNQANYTNLVADADGVIISSSPGETRASGRSGATGAQARACGREGSGRECARRTALPLRKTGQDVAIQLWADPTKPFQRGRIREIAGGADSVTRTYAVRVSVIDPPAGAQLGMDGQPVLFSPTRRTRASCCCCRSRRLQGNDKSTGGVDRRSRHEPREAAPIVAVGQFREDGVTIISGLNAGDVVVTAGVHKLRADQQVRIAGAGAPPTQASN